MALSNPLVSIIIPLFNSEETILETLNSCVDQSYKNIGIIVVDDHSTDSSLNVVKDYQEQYRCLIKVYENRGKGACAARNYGFQLSTGDYIQYLDADDLLDPYKVDSQVKLIQGCDEYTITHCQWGRFYDRTENTKWEYQHINKDYSQPVRYLIDSWNGKGMTAIHCWLTPRNLIEKAGSWNENLLINQDGEFFSRVLLYANKIIYSPEAKVYYRSGNVNSISQIGRISYPKAASLLQSYISYQENWGNQFSNKKLIEALANNYLNFIYLFYPLHQNLTILAEEQFKSLGLKNMWPVGGKNFKRFAGLVGFKNALRSRRLIQRFKENLT